MKQEIRYDVMIIGGGPAGISSLLWASELGLKAVLIEGENRLGGQLHSIYNPISNYPGRAAKKGREMLRHFVGSLKDLGSLCHLNESVIDFDANTVTAKLADGKVVSARAAIVATGVRRRRLGITGETEFAGKGILESGSKERTKVAGKIVAIVGGGDAALENALMLAEFARKVYVIHRRDEFSARKEFVQPARRNKNIEFLFGASVKSIDGDKNLSAVTISYEASQDQRILPVDAVLLRIGVEPNSEIVRSQVKLDKSGYISVNSRCETSRPNILAVGDVASPSAPTIITAAGMAATAVKVIAKSLRDNR